MKKFLAILAIAGVFTACNNASEGEGGEDTTTVTVDPTAPVTTDTAAAGTGMDTATTGATTTDTTTVR